VVTRLESAVLVQSSDWAAALPGGPLSAAQRADLRRGLRASDLDFAQLYRPGPNGWKLEDQIVPERVIVTQGPDLSTEIDSALASSRVIHSPRGALAAAARLRDGRALVAGMWVNPSFFAQLDTVALAATYYPRTAVYLGPQRLEAWVRLAGMVLLLLTLAIVLATVLARGTSRPLAELAHAFERVAAGERGTRVSPRGALELRSLAESFNRMTERLEAAREAVLRSEREAAWRDVARKLAHEFRNMLTPMQLSLQLIESELDTLTGPQREAMSEGLKSALREVDHLKRLAEQFSQYARLPEPRFEAIDLSEVARAAATPSPGAAIVTRAASKPVPVRGDPLLLSRAISNLLLNAIEASPAGSTVEVHTAAENGHGVIEILDRGGGLPPEVAPRLFEPYVSTKQRGSGLGLSLTRDIARQHGGEVTLEDRPGGGARARLVLPLACEPHRDPGAAGVSSPDTPSSGAATP
jgi:nitrogen fixation/metabolism regulation signal transduction histidine kinase